MNGEGDYNLNSIKLEEVTESFLGLDQDVRGCQNDEHYDECTTRQYIENMREKCGCLPLSISISDQVIFSFSSFQIIYTMTYILTTFDAGYCLQDIK